MIERLEEVKSNIESLFVSLEDEVAKAETIDDIIELRKEYFKQHRYILSYFLYIQEEIEKDE